MAAPAKVLFLTLYYPPSSAGAVRRVRALAEGLPEHGIAVEAVSSTGAPDHRYVSRAHQLRAWSGRMKLGRLYRASTKWLAMPDEHVLDLADLYGAVKDIRPDLILAAKDIRPDLILAASTPHSMLVLASLLSKKLGVPWVADLHDPWEEHPKLPRPTPLHALAQRTMARRVLSSAAGVLVATDTMGDSIRSTVPGVPVHTYFNGFDPELFGAPSDGSSDPIVVGYYGSIYRPLDPELLADGVARAGAVLEHAGSDYDGDLAKAAAQFGVDFRALGMLDEREAVARMQAAHVLAMMLPMSPDWAYSLTQKLTQYLGCGRPILGLVPDGEAARLIERHDAGIAVTTQDPEAVARAIRTLARRPGRSSPPTELTWSNQVAGVAEFLRARL